jgi:hypothetical protein
VLSQGLGQLQGIQAKDNSKRSEPGLTTYALFKDEIRDFHTCTRSFDGTGFASSK